MPSKNPVISLTRAFHDQVLSHQDLQALQPDIQAAISQENGIARIATRWSATDLERLTQGWFLAQPMKWPVDADIELRQQIDGKSAIGALKSLSPLAIQIFACLADAFEKWVVPLRNGSVTATGHIRGGTLVELSAAIWSRPHTWIDWFAGDLGKFEAVESDGPPIFVPEWRAVAVETMQAPRAPSTRPQHAHERAERAIKQLWPNLQDRIGISAKARDRKINDWLESQGLGPVSPATIKRCLFPK